MTAAFSDVPSIEDVSSIEDVIEGAAGEVPEEFSDMLREALNRLSQRFVQHEMSPTAKKFSDGLRTALFSSAASIELSIPRCREASLALTKLEEALFYVNAAIARHGVNLEDL